MESVQAYAICPYGKALSKLAHQLSVSAELGRQMSIGVRDDGEDPAAIAEIDSQTHQTMRQAATTLGKLAACEHCIMGIVRTGHEVVARQECPNDDTELVEMPSQ